MQPTKEELDKQWLAWCADWDAAEHEILTLFHTRWMWRVITSLMNAGVPERQFTVVQNYLIRTYVGTLCMGIRREVDPKARTSSLARCLQVLAHRPVMASRTRYVAAATASRDSTQSAWYDSEIEQGFEQFAPAGRETIDPAIPRQALKELAAATEPIKKYSDKTLAHRERNGDIEKLTPTWDEINTALGAVGATLKQFYPLRHAGAGLGQLTPVTSLDFVDMFRVPWYADGWTVPPDED